MPDVMVEPTIREEEDCFVLPLTGREVDQICIDYAVTLVIDGTDTVRLDSPFTVSFSDRTLLVDPQRLDTVAPVLDLFRAVILRAAAGRDGSLLLSFDDDRSLRIEADPDGEAWEIGGGLPPISPSYRIVSLPAGSGIEFS
ncbi:MAG: hypothetical protein IPM08_02190 [Actinomycetales bacterium]|nr:hypothetical protein [Actinomycetales bacterium]